MSVSNGSLSKGPAATSNERPDAGGEPSSYASKWARAMYGAHPGATARKVVPLRTPAAPPAAPGGAPAPKPVSPAPRRPAPAQSAQRRPTGPELLAEDEVLKRLLQRHAPDPQPLVARPTRDPIVFALGMVARLMVAGTAAAVAALLLLGVIPLPFRLGPAVTHEVATRLTAPVPMTVAAASPAAVSRSVTPVAPVAVRTADPAPRTTLTTAATTTAAPAAAPTEGWVPDAGEIDQLVKRGEDLLAQGDVAAARLVLGRAAAASDPRAALSLGATYDPAMLRQLHVVGVSPDVAQARAWYEKAAGYGSRDAAARLAALPSADP
ncbi:MAG TPA: hypothetical protein VGG01_21025 [Xanthobacteraceae bacterium]|jgi:hypothetical protein